MIFGMAHNPLLDAMQLVVFGLACWSVYLAVRHAIFFRTCSRHIGQSMMLFFVEQIICSVGTMIFSANSLYATLSGDVAANWNTVDPWAAVGIRVVMFLAMIHSTTHLTHSIREILDRDDVI